MKKSLTASLFMTTFAIAVVASSCKENGYQTKQVTDPNGYTYSVLPDANLATDLAQQPLSLDLNQRVG